MRNGYPTEAEQNGCRQRLLWHPSCHQRFPLAVAKAETFTQETKSIAMQIWKLSAITPSDPRWSKQDFTGPFVIRAVGEYEARQIAQMKTIQFHRVDDKNRFQSSPWINPEITSSEIVTDSGFMEDGEPVMLSPAPDHFR